jgi:nucleoside-diphosphate-sugar epimerase
MEMMSGRESAPGNVQERSVLLTGGSGFVGGRVARRLAALGHRVHAVVRHAGALDELRSDRVRVIEGDFVSPEVTARGAAGADVIVHCAAAAPPDLETARRINLEGTRSVVEAALSSGATRLIHISSVSVYALEDRPLVDEGCPLKETGDAYGVTKAEGDRLVLDSAARGLRATILRPGAILGASPTSTWAVKVPDRVRTRLVKLRIDGDDTLPYLHVEDLVDAVLLAMDSERAVGRVYNMVDGHTTVRAYTDEVRRWFETPPLEIIPPADVPPGSYWTGRVDSRRVREELGYAPRRTYDEGMEEARAYWERHPAPSAPPSGRS